MRTVKEINQKRNPFYKPKKLRICAYVRVSTESIGQLGSLQNQTEHYQNKFTTNSEFEFCGIFSDAGISGAKTDRPGLVAMMEKAKAGEVDLIITKSISRFARNTLILLESVRELKAIGVGVIFEEQGINTLHSEGELLLTVLAAIAEEERKAVRENVKWAIEKKFKRGEVIVDVNRLIGYDKDENGRFVINKEQAEVVRKIYKLFLAGETGYKIAKDFNEKSIPTYTNKPWQSGRILGIISNEKYKGDCLMQKTYVTDNGKGIINRGQKAKYYVENSHLPIVSRNDWEKAQLIRENRKTKIYPFSNMFRCKYCGATLIRVVHQGRWVSWICATYMQKGKGVCEGTRISEGKLKEVTNGIVINEPMVVEEVTNGNYSKKRSEKSFRIIPVTEYYRSRNNGE
ncbi:recombinase family protein [Clostridium sp.]|uniref:recombinase family protein n=1 Tax=Clostridium sp. TaxID=1506 RepID=UPI001A4FB64B|nr:recombinase family protein [Clostridium sp.]MBK5243247.1 recombinase family protein [Clostridium sp.]